MPHTIVVIGNERRFIDASRPFIKHLRKSARCERVTFLRGAYYTPAELARRIQAAVRAAPKSEPLLVAYFGHGTEGAWGYALEHQDKYLDLDYRTLAKTLARHDGPLVVLNDCCHAESLAPHLEKAGISPTRCLLISACEASESTIPGTGKEVLAQWNAREVFEPVVEREELCVIGEFRYVPPLLIRLRDWWENARIRIRNRFVAKDKRRPTIIRLHRAPNVGKYACHDVITERTIGRRWGVTLDHHFFKKPS